MNPYNQKYYNNPYQNEIDETKKQMNKFDNHIHSIAIRIFALLLALGVIYLLFKPQ